MASSNRHWPSMFKVKPCNQHRRWQHDISPIHQRNPQAPGSEERGPDPKPRWNPRPEQIRILEAIFDSGMVNPSGDEIRRICAKLQEYGQVGDANVFYWFQNRKSRSKNKQRQLQSAAAAARLHRRPPKPAAAAAAAASSSSSSDHSTGSDKSLLKPVHLRYTSSCLEFGVGDAAAVSHSHPGYSLAAAKAVPESVLWSELLGAGDDGRKLWVQLHHLYAAAAAAAGVSTATSAAAPCVNASAGCDPTIVDGPVSEIQVMDGGGGREWGSAACRRTSTVVTGEAAFEVTAGRLNVREVFGKEAVLLDQSGHPLLTDEAGFTLLPLQHGAAYYLNTTRSLQQIVAMKTSNKLIPWFS